MTPPSRPRSLPAGGGWRGQERPGRHEGPRAAAPAQAWRKRAATQPRRAGGGGRPPRRPARAGGHPGGWSQPLGEPRLQQPPAPGEGGLGGTDTRLAGVRSSAEGCAAAAAAGPTQVRAGPSLPSPPASYLLEGEGPGDGAGAAGDAHQALPHEGAVAGGVVAPQHLGLPGAALPQPPDEGLQRGGLGVAAAQGGQHGREGLSARHVVAREHAATRRGTALPSGPFPSRTATPSSAPPPGNGELLLKNKQANKRKKKKPKPKRCWFLNKKIKQTPSHNCVPPPPGPNVAAEGRRLR